MKKRFAIPSPAEMTGSKSSSAMEYANLLTWTEQVHEIIVTMPTFGQVADWRGKLITTCDYGVSYTAPNPPVWNEGYPVWWHLTNLCLLDEPIPCRGCIGM